MNEIIFYDIRFESESGDVYKITTADIQKAISVYNRVQNMNNVVVLKRSTKIGCEEIACEVTADIKDMNEQWNKILGIVQR